MTATRRRRPRPPPPPPQEKEKLPRELDPRNPNFRLQALLDEGSVELITPDDDSGMLAAVGTINGCRVVAFCSDATVMGGAMGVQGCDVVVRAYERAMADRVPILGHLALRRRPAGRGRAVPARGRPDLPRDDPGLGQDPADLHRARLRGRRGGVRAGPDRPGDPGPRGPDLRHRSGRGALGDRRGRRHAAARRAGHPRPPLRGRARGGRRRGRRHPTGAGSSRPCWPTRASTADEVDDSTWPRCCPSRPSGPTTCIR